MFDPFSHCSSVKFGGVRHFKFICISALIYKIRSKICCLYVVHMDMFKIQILAILSIALRCHQTCLAFEIYIIHEKIFKLSLAFDYTKTKYINHIRGLHKYKNRKPKSNSITQNRNVIVQDRRNY